MADKPYLIIWNPGAGSTDRAARLRSEFESRPDVRLLETSSVEDAQQAASDAASRGVRQVIAAGGDGTVNAAIRGLCEHENRPALGILPLGTGNDLCRTLRIPLDPMQAAKLLMSEAQPPRLIDLVRVESSQGSTLFANVCSGGNSQRVAQRLTNDIKKAWGAWCYMRGAIEVLTDLTGFAVKVKLDDRPWKSLEIWNIVIGNGKTAAGGLPVAPQADPGDGLLDVIFVQDGTPLDAATLSAEFFLGDFLEDERVIFQRAQRIELESDPPMQFVADGETSAVSPVTFTIQPHALRVIAGPLLEHERI